MILIDLLVIVGIAIMGIVIVALIKPNDGLASKKVLMRRITALESTMSDLDDQARNEYAVTSNPYAASVVDTISHHRRQNREIV